jgi:hypothetical protein
VPTGWRLSNEELRIRVYGSKFVGRNLVHRDATPVSGPDASPVGPSSAPGMLPPLSRTEPLKELDSVVRNFGSDGSHRRMSAVGTGAYPRLDPWPVSRGARLKDDYGRLSRASRCEVVEVLVLVAPELP